MTFRARILGAAAGGGLPQWNCGCLNCRLARKGDIDPQSQSSLAVSPDGKAWAVLNASPDMRDQFSRTSELHPTDLRSLPLATVLVTNGDIDHVAGLLTLREMQPFTLAATRGIHDVLDANPIFDALKRSVVTRKSVSLEVPFDLLPGLEATLFAVPGKVPLYMEREEVDTRLVGDQTVGVELRSGSTRVYYIPGCAMMTDALRTRLDGADLVFFDGTLWRDDEMQRTGLGEKTGARMGHMSMSGPDGSIAAFETIRVDRKIFVHMNNTNPVHRPDSDERAQAEAAGWTVGRDGMEITL